MENSKVPSVMSRQDSAGVWMQGEMRSQELELGDVLYVGLQVNVLIILFKRVLD